MDVVYGAQPARSICNAGPLEICALWSAEAPLRYDCHGLLDPTKAIERRCDTFAAG